MVKFYTATSSHTHPFETVTLAYFLRYPNPYSTHVLSTDTISRHFDPQTQRLYTSRLHLKRSRLPPALLAILPASLTNSKDGKSSQTYILEQTVVDVANGVMFTESRNLEFTGVLSATEQQLFARPGANVSRFIATFRASPARGALAPPSTFFARAGPEADGDAAAGKTLVRTMVELKSRLGEVTKERLGIGRKDDGTSSGGSSQPGFFRAWTTGSLQRTIESFGYSRTERAVPKAKEGLNVVLERLRQGGVVAVLEGMKRDRETASQDAA